MIFKQQKKNELWDKIKQNIAIRQRRDTDN